MATKQKDLIANPPHVLTALQYGYNTPSTLYVQPGKIWQLPYNKQVAQHNNLSCALVYFEPLLPILKQCNQGRTMHYIIHLSHTMSTNHNGQPEKDVNPDFIINFFQQDMHVIQHRKNLLLHNNKREDTSQLRTSCGNKNLTLTEEFKRSEDRITACPSVTRGGLHHQSLISSFRSEGCFINRVRININIISAPLTGCSAGSGIVDRHTIK